MRGHLDHAPSEHIPTLWDEYFTPRPYQLTRWLILRLLGVVYVFAFLGLWFQELPLLGAHGLTPIATYVRDTTFIDTPSVFVLDASDTAIRVWTAIGLVLALACALGYANLPSLLVLWAIYGSFERVGQDWFAFGWEIQILETTLIAAFLAHPWDPRPLAARAPPATAIVLMRWLAFRIMLGAGLIKWRGDPCWQDLTCLDSHFETQPIPNPLSPAFHHAPHVVHAAGVAFNHLVELILPWFAFGPRVVRLIAGCAMLAFQATLIASGNLAFLNWLTLVPVLALLDDDFLRWLVPKRLRARVPAGGAPARWPHRIAVYLFAAVVAVKSCDVVVNLASSHQRMNASYDRLALVNTYGAFGSIGTERYELVIEGTLDDDPQAARWQTYELPCKPTALDRRPCVLGPYHMRLDWLIWFAAMTDRPSSLWVIAFAWKLLDGDTGIRELLAVDPFDGAAPRWVRIRRFLYHLQPYGAGDWWTRDADTESMYLAPVSRDSKLFVDVFARYGAVSPTLR